MVLLDTSALLAHYYHENGEVAVEQLLQSGEAWVAAPTWLEMRINITAHNADAVVRAYQGIVAGTVDITREIAEAAFTIRTSSNQRIPAVDSLIAAAAFLRGFRLVHRDKHMARVPQHLVPQTILPPKA